MSMVGHELSFLDSYLECRSWEAVRGLGFTLSQISHGRFRAEVGRGIVCSICSVEIRLQEALGEARISFLVRCVLVRWYMLLVQENLRVVQMHCTQSPFGVQ